MTVSYIISAIVLAIVFSSVVFVLIGKIEHKQRKINLSWMLMMMLIAVISILTMVLIYHAQHDISEDAVQNAYEQGVADGKSSATHTLPTNEEMEEWFSSTQEVIVGKNEGGDVAVHIIDHNGEEWVLYADSTQTK